MNNTLSSSKDRSETKIHHHQQLRNESIALEKIGRRCSRTCSSNKMTLKKLTLLAWKSERGRWLCYYCHCFARGLSNVSFPSIVTSIHPPRLCRSTSTEPSRFSLSSLEWVEWTFKLRCFASNEKNLTQKTQEREVFHHRIIVAFIFYFFLQIRLDEFKPWQLLQVAIIEGTSVLQHGMTHILFLQNK